MRESFERLFNYLLNDRSSKPIIKTSDSLVVTLVSACNTEGTNSLVHIDRRVT